MKGWDRSHSALFLQKAGLTAKSQVCKVFKPSSRAEGAGMSSGGRLPEAWAGAECLFVYLGEFWPYSHHAIASGSLKCEDNDML